MFSLSLSLSSDTCLYNYPETSCLYCFLHLMAFKIIVSIGSRAIFTRVQYVNMRQRQCSHVRGLILDVPFITVQSGWCWPELYLNGMNILAYIWMQSCFVLFRFPKIVLELNSSPSLWLPLKKKKWSCRLGSFRVRINSLNLVKYVL